MSSNFFNSISNVNTLTNPKDSNSQGLFISARVKDIILDETHPEWEKYGGPAAAGAIKYQVLSNEVDTQNTVNLPIAFPLYSHIKHYPLKEEVVLIFKGPSESLEDSTASVKRYYLDIVNLWNNPNHNASPENTTQAPSFGNAFNEAGDVNPMQAFEGDVIFEGRQGQSLRFSTGYQGVTPWTTEEDGKPITVISNGQQEVGNGYELITENIDEDSSSIYLTSNQALNFTPASTNRTSYTNPPIEGNSYSNNQVLLNSGRLYFNANQESILMSGNESIGLSADSINLDGTSTIIAESERIELGKNANQGVLLGEDTVSLLRTLLDELRSLSISLSTAISTPPGSTIVQLQEAGRSLLTTVTTLDKDLDTLPSRKTFVK